MPDEPSHALRFERADSRPDLLAPVVTEIVRAWRGEPGQEIAVAEIDPALADPAAFCAHYGVDPADYVDCVVLTVRRGEAAHLAACVVPADRALALDDVVRPHFGARHVTFAPADEVTVETGMEAGAITPVGLPGAWPVLVDAALAARASVLVGSGVRRSKLAVPGQVLAALPGGTVLEGLGLHKDV